MPIVPLFWIVALLLVAAALFMLVRPLLRAPVADPTGGEVRASTYVFRDQKRQLDAECAAGAISAEERHVAIDELALRLSADLDSHAATPPARSPRGRMAWAFALILVLPTTAVALYALLGSPDAMRVSAARERPAMTQVQIIAMVDKLAARMKANPEDAQGWKLLGRSYSALGRYREAADAFREASERAPADATVVADWADALGMANGGTLVGEPSRLIERALAIEPANPKALTLASAAAVERKDFDAAITSWRKLKGEFPPGSAQDRELDQLIAQANAAGARAASAPR
jgi:cytochrome c-type biogenesis protein CcmH